jgi:RND family efflux transporter MFP subunit
MYNKVMSLLTTISKKLSGLSRKTIITGSIIIVVLLGGFLLFRPKAPVRQFVTVAQGPITETVSITGNTTPTSSVSLGFGTGGTIAGVYTAVGKSVMRGQVLAVLNSGNAAGQLRQAQANLALQMAQGQNTTVNVEAVQKEQDILVANAHHTLLSSGLQASPADVTTTVVPPTISGDYTGTEGDYVIHMYPSNSSTGESFYISGLESGFNNQAASNAVSLGTHGLYIQFPTGPLAQYGNSVWTVSIPNAKSATYTANNNAYVAAQANRAKAIADAQAAIANNQSGTTVSQAQIASVQAAVQSAQAALQNYQIVAPISGVVTQFDAKRGEFASPGTPLVSVISSNSFEVDALVSEIDIGKVALANKVSMTIDAFPGETFMGTIFYISPAQTTTGGVVGYKIKIAFDKNDARMKSGLTANSVITTRQKEAVLFLPQYAILQTDKGTFVEIVENGKVKNMPVTLGLQDQNGNVEIASGVIKGEQVLNIGLK